MMLGVGAALMVPAQPALLLSPTRAAAGYVAALVRQNERSKTSRKGREGGGRAKEGSGTTWGPGCSRLEPPPPYNLPNSDRFITSRSGVRLSCNRGQ